MTQPVWIIHVLKLEAKVFPDGLNVGYDRQRRVKEDSKNLARAIRKMELPLSEIVGDKILHKD